MLGAADAASSPDECERARFGARWAGAAALTSGEMLRWGSANGVAASESRVRSAADADPGTATAVAAVGAAVGAAAALVPYGCDDVFGAAGVAGARVR